MRAPPDNAADADHCIVHQRRDPRVVALEMLRPIRCMTRASVLETLHNIVDSKEACLRHRFGLKASATAADPRLDLPYTLLKLDSPCPLGWTSVLASKHSTFSD